LTKCATTFREPLIDEKTDELKNVLVVNNDRYIEDSLIEGLSPHTNPDKSTQYARLTDVPLPPLTSAVELADINQNLPPWLQGSEVAKPGSLRLYFPVETTKAGGTSSSYWTPANTLTNILQRQTSRSAYYTLALLLATPLVTGCFVWRFYAANSSIYQLRLNVLPPAISTCVFQLTSVMKSVRCPPPFMT